MKNLRLLIFYFFTVICGGGLFFLLSLIEIKNLLNVVERRVQEDVIFENGKWNTAAYNADPYLPTTAPLYVFAEDGYVIERWKPITGFLDAADFKHLLTFTRVQTVEVSTNQDWRVLSVPIELENEAVGVITLSYFHPLNQNLSQIDQELTAVAKQIQDHIVIEENTFRVEKFDERKVPYYIAYQVVNKFNQIVFKSNNSNSVDRLPNFIDPSYIASQLIKPAWQFIQDQRTKEIFLIKTHPLHLGDESTPRQGVIVVGGSLKPVLSVLYKYVVFLSILGMGTFLISEVNRYVYENFLVRWNRDKKVTLRFDSKNSQLIVNDVSTPIEYASNQYYLLSAVFRSPYKRWEVDEIIEKFGDELNSRSWRKVYDATSSVNKKMRNILGKKLILVEGKTFRFNSELIDSL